MRVSGPPPPAEVAEAVWFVGAEAVTNAVKHAAAACIDIELTGDDGAVVLTVSDDGAGAADPGAGSGLRALVDRVEALDGCLQVISPPGRGTTVVASFAVGTVSRSAATVAPRTPC